MGHLLDFLSLHDPLGRASKLYWNLLSGCRIKSPDIDNDLEISTLKIVFQWTWRLQHQSWSTMRPRDAEQSVVLPITFIFQRWMWQFSLVVTVLNVNIVTLHWTMLLPRWVTVHRYTILVFNKPPKLTQLGHPLSPPHTPHPPVVPPMISCKTWTFCLNTVTRRNRYKLNWNDKRSTNKYPNQISNLDISTN